MAAALTLLTEISISVMGVGTWGRSRVSGMGGLGQTSPASLLSASSSPCMGATYLPAWVSALPGN